MLENKNVSEVFNLSGKYQSKYNILKDFYFTDLTQKEIAAKNNLSVTRVQMIHGEIIRRLRKNREYWRAIFADIEEECRHLWEPFDSDITLEIASDFCQAILIKKGWQINNTIAYIPVLIMRIVVDQDLDDYEKYPDFSLAACSIKPYIEKHPEVLRKLGKIDEWSYTKIIEFVLEQYGMPMDRKELLLKVQSLNKRNTFNITSFNAAINDMKHLVAKTVDGKYCIVYWGIPCEDLYVDLIAEVIKTKKRPLTAYEIQQELWNVKGLSEERLLLYLSRHPRFYQSILGVEVDRYTSTYGLRTWLLENAKSKSRTPKWLTESSESVKRIEEFGARGYDIRELVKKDQ